eukprot:3939782-Rhodomonas_salina.2
MTAHGGAGTWVLHVDVLCHAAAADQGLRQLDSLPAKGRAVQIPRVIKGRGSTFPVLAENVSQCHPQSFTISAFANKHRIGRSTGPYLALNLLHNVCTDIVDDRGVLPAVNVNW